MKLPIRLPPLLYILIFNQFHIGNVINAIGLSIYIVDRFGAADLAVGSLGAITLLCYGSFAWLGGLMADRYPKRVLIPTGLSLLTLAFWAIPYAEKLGHVIALSGLCSMAHVIIMPSTFGLVAESVGPRRVSRYLGLNALVLVMAGMTAAFLVGRLYAWGGAMGTFHTCAAISASALVVMLVFAPRQEAGEAPSPTGRVSDPTGLPAPPAPALHIHRHARAFLFAALGLNFLGFFVGVLHQYFLVRVATLPEFSLSLPEQSNLQALRMMASGVGYALGVAWTGWHWRRWPFWALGGLMTVVTLLGGFAPGPAPLAAAIALGGLTTAICNQLSLFYAVGSGAVKGGRGAGLTESALAFGGASGPMLGGLAASLAGTPRAALFVPLVPILACAALWAWLLPRGEGEEL